MYVQSIQYICTDNIAAHRATDLGEYIRTHALMQYMYAMVSKAHKVHRISSKQRCTD